MLLVYLNEVYSSIKNDSTLKLMEWENKKNPELLKNKDDKSSNPNEPTDNSSSTPKEDDKTLNTVDSKPEEISSSKKNQKSTSDDSTNEEINRNDITNDSNENATDQQIKFGELVFRDYKKPTPSDQISMGNPFSQMPGNMKHLIDDNGQIMTRQRIRNQQGAFEEARDKISSVNVANIRKTLLTDDVDYDGGFPGEYILPLLSNIPPFEDSENIKRGKLFVPKNRRFLETRRLPEESFAESLPRFSKSLSVETPNIFKDDESEMSGITENNEINKIIDNKTTEVLKKSKNMNNENLSEINQKEDQKKNISKEKVVVDAKKETVREAEKIEEKINEAKEESKKEGKGAKMTEIFSTKPQNNKPISMSLPTSLETPEISRNLFDNNKSSNTVDTEKESGLNKKLIIEQINESEKQLVEIEDLTKNVKANLNKLKEELQAKKDDQRNIELNIIEVKEKTPENK